MGTNSISALNSGEKDRNECEECDRLSRVNAELLDAVKITLSDLEANIANGCYRESPNVLIYRDQLKALVAKATGTPAPSQSDRLAALGRHHSNSPFAQQRT